MWRLSLKNGLLTVYITSNGAEIKICYEGFDNFLLWTVPEAGFICIEPWCGLPDFFDSNCNLVEKKGIVKLGVNEQCKKTIV